MYLKNHQDRHFHNYEMVPHFRFSGDGCLSSTNIEKTPLIVNHLALSGK